MVKCISKEVTTKVTILVAVKTSTDLVIAADSKVTTSGIGGIDPTTGNPIWIEQTYDFGTKIAFNNNHSWTVAIAGQSSFGDIQISDIVEQYMSFDFSSRLEQEEDLKRFVNLIGEIRSSKFTEFKLSEVDWPVSKLLFFSSDPEGRGVRAWEAVYGPPDPSIVEILENTNVYFAGSCEYVLTLLYNHCFNASHEVAATIEVKEDILFKAYREKYLAPITKLNVAVMPLQDAMDFAVFLAKVQIHMERFLPGTARCGGPIDIAVVRGLPKHEVIWYPGKELRHPGAM